MNNSYRTMKSIQTTDRTGHFIAPNRWYGDRYPRTLQEAFGEGAKLHVEEPDRIGLTCAVALAFFTLGVIGIAALLAV